MKFSPVLAGAFCLATTAFASPIAPVGKEVTDKVDSALEPVTGIIAPVTGGVTDEVALPEVENISQGLLMKLAPAVGLLVGGLGLGALAPSLMGLLSALSVGLKRDAVPEGLMAEINLPGASELQKEQVIKGAQALVTHLNLVEDTPVDGMADDLLAKVKGLVEKILGGLNLQSLLGGVAGKRQVPELPIGANKGLLAGIAAPVAGLVTALGLGSLAPGLLALLNTLSEGL